MFFRRLPLVLLLILFVAVSPAVSTQLSARSQQQAGGSLVYMPMVFRNYPWASPFGYQTSPGMLSNPTVKTQVGNLQAKWVRLGMLSWKSVQPTPLASYLWNTQSTLEEDLRSATSLQLTPIVIVGDSPAWATETYHGANGLRFQTSCGPIRSDRLADFAAFMTQVVERYKNPPYNVHYWEIGNEPDVDPHEVQPDNIFGCWGNRDDPYYGGTYYGEMLKVIAPAIRQADPHAKILIGGLLLNAPNTGGATNTAGLFFEGILRAPNVANSFDIVAYHAYSFYQGPAVDSDAAGNWASMGGPTRGKASYLRAIMARYSVTKPLFMTETGMISITPDSGFLQAQSDYVVRMLARAWSTGLIGLTWYTLDGPGWRDGALLDQNQSPRPVYTAYQQFIKQTELSDTVTKLDTVIYGPTIEAYRFTNGSKTTDVIWTNGTSLETVTIPESKFTRALDQYGGTIMPNTPGNGTVLLLAGFSPIYIQRAP